MSPSGMGAPPRWRLLQRQATREKSIAKGDMNKSPIAKQEEGQTWLVTGDDGLGEDGVASFRTFLTRIFLVLARARGATASESRFRLGVNLTVLG
jgi:hypothetical protein